MTVPSRSWLLSLIFFAGCATPPAAAPTEPAVPQAKTYPAPVLAPDRPALADGSRRLPADGAIPQAYTLRLQIDPRQSDTRGTVAIDVQLPSPRRRHFAACQKADHRAR